MHEAWGFALDTYGTHQFDRWVGIYPSRHGLKCDVGRGTHGVDLIASAQRLAPGSKIRSLSPSAPLVRPHRPSGPLWAFIEAPTSPEAHDNAPTTGCIAGSRSTTLKKDVATRARRANIANGDDRKRRASVGWYVCRSSPDFTATQRHLFAHGSDDRAAFIEHLRPTVRPGPCRVADWPRGTDCPSRRRLGTPSAPRAGRQQGGRVRVDDAGPLGRRDHQARKVPYGSTQRARWRPRNTGQARRTSPSSDGLCNPPVPGRAPFPLAPCRPHSWNEETGEVWRNPRPSEP